MGRFGRHHRRLCRRAGPGGGAPPAVRRGTPARRVDRVIDRVSRPRIFHSDGYADQPCRARLVALVMGGLLIVAALVGKAACAIGVGRGTDRGTVVLGLLPRGEVTLVLANLGLSLAVFDEGVFAALMTVVLA